MTDSYRIAGTVTIDPATGRPSLGQTRLVPMQRYHGQWHDTYKFGVFVDGNVWNQLATWVAGMGKIAGAGLNGVFSTNTSPYLHEQLQHQIQQGTELLPDYPLADLRCYLGVEHQQTVAPSSTLATSWYNSANVPTPTIPIAQSVIQPSLDAYVRSPIVDALLVGDDCTGTAITSKGYRAAMMCDALKGLNPDLAYSAVYTDPASFALQTNKELLATYMYPCTYPNAEGDWFTTQWGGDFHMGIRTRWGSVLQSASQVYWIAQTHKTNGTGSATLRYPTPNEIRGQTWVLTGEGVKSIFWFAGTDSPGVWDGIFHPNSAARLAAVIEMNQRLSPEIRAAILASTRVSDQFAASGGGQLYPHGNAPSAYISTLQNIWGDPPGQYYAVVCNRSTSPATVTISATGSLTGRLVGMEPGDWPLGGVSVPLGGSITLGPLDGTMFRLEP